MTAIPSTSGRCRGDHQPLDRRQVAASSNRPVFQRIDPEVTGLRRTEDQRQCAGGQHQDGERHQLQCIRRVVVPCRRRLALLGRELFAGRWLSVFHGVEILDREELGRSSRLVGGQRELLRGVGFDRRLRSEWLAVGCRWGLGGVR